jgi:hypothetical protein
VASAKKEGGADVPPTCGQLLNADASIQGVPGALRMKWIPAFAGMTAETSRAVAHEMDSRFRGNDGGNEFGRK